MFDLVCPSRNLGPGVYRNQAINAWFTSLKGAWLTRVAPSNHWSSQLFLLAEDSRSSIKSFSSHFWHHGLFPLTIVLLLFIVLFRYWGTLMLVFDLVWVSRDVGLSVYRDQAINAWFTWSRGAWKTLVVPFNHSITDGVSVCSVPLYRVFPSVSDHVCEC